MSTLVHWAYVIDQGNGGHIARSSSPAITIQRIQLGEHVLTFPTNVHNTGVVATLNNSVGFITAVPGDVSGLLPNQVRVLIMNPNNSFGARDFTVVVYCEIQAIKTTVKIKKNK